MIKSFLKGIVIGIANIVPGVSGGTMMVSMGIYDKLIHCITHLFSEFKKSVLFILPIAIGMVVAIAASSFGLKWLSENYPIQTNLMFIGLIIGGFPAIYGKVREKTIKMGHMLAGLLFFAFVVAMAILWGGEGNAADVSVNVFNVIKFVGVGVIASATMVIPGVSGSMVLMLMGFYYPVINAITDFISALTAFDVPRILAGCGILVPFGIGIVIGIFVIAKLMEIILEKFPLYAYWAIIGLIAASPIAIWMIMMKKSNPTVSLMSVATGMIALAVGFFVARKLGD